MQPLRPTDLRMMGSNSALRYRHQTKPTEDKKTDTDARKQLETVEEFEEHESLELSSRPESSQSNVSGASRYSAQRQFTINAKPVPKNAEPETSSTGFLPLLPLVLALLPAAVAILAGETAGVFATDSLLLIAVGWVMWSMREGSWRLYTFRLEQDPEQSATIPLILYMATPFAGALVMRFARDQLSAGSHLVTNFNIFLYVTLETARGVSKLAVHSAPSTSRRRDDDVENEATKKIQRLEYELETVQAQLNGLGRRVIDNESVLHSELYTVWRNMDQMTEDISQIDHTSSDSTSRAKMKQLMSPGIPEDSNSASTGARPVRVLKTAIEKTPTRRATTTTNTTAPVKHKSRVSKGIEKDKHPENANLTKKKSSIEKQEIQPAPTTTTGVAKDFWASRTATYQQHSALWWPIATVWNMTLYLMLLLPFRITHRLFTTVVSTARRLLDLPRRSIAARF